MITPEYVRTMAAYNSEMNRRFYGAAGRLSDLERRRDGGAFFGSIHRTLHHVLWADWMWMSRFDGWDRPTDDGWRRASAGEDFADLRGRRVVTDGLLEGWAGRVGADWLAGELVWFSGGSGAEMRSGVGLLVVHLFNHQTHHRGQAHALITAAGEATGATDLPWVI